MRWIRTASVDSGVRRSSVALVQQQRKNPGDAPKRSSDGIGLQWRRSHIGRPELASLGQCTPVVADSAAALVGVSSPLDRHTDFAYNTAHTSHRRIERWQKE
jgi:hypothetical protein